jgi:hypothetical protein
MTGSPPRRSEAEQTFPQRYREAHPGWAPTAQKPHPVSRRLWRALGTHLAPLRPRLGSTRMSPAPGELGQVTVHVTSRSSGRSGWR